jgi:opacity protein-like surface antigen
MKNILVAFAVTLGLCSSAVAADVAMPTKAPITPPAPIQGWTYSLTPYFWAISLDGSTTVKGRTSDVDVGFFNILDHTQFPKGLFQLAALGEARFGRFALLADILYMKVDLSAGATRLRGSDAIGGALGVSAGFGLEMTIAQVAAAYEITRWNGLTSAASTTALDIYAGGRAWWQRANVDISATGTLNIFDLTFTRAGVLSAEKSVSWFDPLVGMRLRHQFAPAWNLVVSGDVGGFDVGSKFTWQVLGALDYEFCRSKSVTWSGMIGYKALSADYSQGAGSTITNTT